MKVAILNITKKQVYMGNKFTKKRFTGIIKCLRVGIFHAAAHCGDNNGSIFNCKYRINVNYMAGGFAVKQPLGTKGDTLIAYLG